MQIAPPIDLMIFPIKNWPKWLEVTTPGIREVRVIFGDFFLIKTFHMFEKDIVALQLSITFYLSFGIKIYSNTNNNKIKKIYKIHFYSRATIWFMGLLRMKCAIMITCQILVVCIISVKNIFSTKTKKVFWQRKKTANLIVAMVSRWFAKFFF